MLLDPALEKYLMEETAKGDDALFHLSISGRDAAEQARLYAERLKEMRGGTMKIGELSFSAAKHTSAVREAFKGGEGGVVIITNAHGLAQPDSGHQMLRTLLSQSWDLGKSTLVFAGDRKAFDAYFNQMPEMQQRLPHAHDIPAIPTPEQLAEQHRRETIEKWRENGMLDVSVGTDTEAPPIAAFQKKKPEIR